MQYLTLPSSFETELKDLWEALRVQTRVIGALIQREIRTRFHNNPLGYFWAVLDPCFHIAVWFFIIGVLNGAGNNAPLHGIGTFIFLASGMLPFSLFATVAAYVVGTVGENKTYVDYPVVTYMDVLISRATVAGCTEIVVAVFIFLGLHIIGLGNLPANYLGLFLPAASLIFFGASYGAAFSCYTYLSPIIRDFKAVGQRFLYFTSGIYFASEQLSPRVLYWLSWNPVLNGVELFRSAYFPNYRCPWASASYVLLCGLVLLLFGLCSERVLRGKISES